MQRVIRFDSLDENIGWLNAHLAGGLFCVVHSKFAEVMKDEVYR